MPREKARSCPDVTPESRSAPLPDPGVGPAGVALGAKAEPNDRVVQGLQDDVVLYQDQPIAVVVADTIPNVVGRSIYLDLNARIQAQAIALGGTITEISPEEANRIALQRAYQPWPKNRWISWNFWSS